MHCHCVQLGGQGSEEKDFLWAYVDEPQAQFQRTTSDLGHNSHRASGQEEASGLLTSLINMDGRKVHIYCRHSLLASLISLSNIRWLFLHLREQRRRSMLNLRTFIFFYSSNVACLHAALLEQGYQISLCCAAARMLQI